MSAPTVLHNWGVPPRTRVKVTRPPLGRLSFMFDEPKGLKALALGSLLPFNDFEEALREAGIPDRIGVFTGGGARPDSKILSSAAAVAVLSRRSGPLYLPWRPVDATLVRPTRFLLVFPDEGVPS